MSKFENYSELIFWDFKRRDNVDYNFKIIKELVKSCKKRKEPELLFKPIFILISAIIECTLYDFLLRIQQHTNEKIKTLNQNDIDKIKQKDLPNKFSNYIDIYRKHSLLGKEGNIYLKLKEVANIRNRIHIQNSNGHKPRDESNLWTKEKIKMSGNLLNEVFMALSVQYPRELFKEKISIEFTKFPKPWSNL